MNLAYYVVLFDWATDALWHAIGLGQPFRDSGHGTFAAETHTFYKAELLVDETVVVNAQVLGTDSRRLHVAYEMHRTRDGVVAALQELMYLSVDLATRRVAPFPPEFAAGLRAAGLAHAALPRPDWVGRRIAMPAHLPA